MSVSAQETVFHHVGNGQTVTFPFGCQVPQASDLQVYRNDVLVASGFSVSGIGVPTGGAVTFDIAPADQAQVRLERVVSLERTTDYQQNGDFLARVVNPDFNRIWMALQQHATIHGRALLAPKSDATGPAPLPTIAERANKLLSFDHAGNPIAALPASGSATELQAELLAAAGAGLVGYANDDTPITAARALDILYFGIINVLNPKFAGGADPTGIADSTAAIQAAVDRLAQRGGLLHIPYGVYNVDMIQIKDCVVSCAMQIDGAIFVGTATQNRAGVFDIVNCVDFTIGGSFRIFGNNNANYDMGVCVRAQLGTSQSTSRVNIYNATVRNLKIGFGVGRYNIDYQCSEISFFGCNTFQCPTAMYCGGSQTGASFDGCNLVSELNPALVGAANRVIWMEGGFVTIVGGEVVFAETADSTAILLNPCSSPVYGNQYPILRITGAHIETQSQLMVITNNRGLAAPDSRSANVGILNCGGYVSGNAGAQDFIYIGDASYVGALSVKMCNFYSDLARTAYNISSAAVGARISCDEQSFGRNFKHWFGGISGGLVAHSMMPVARVTGINATLPAGEQKCAFTSVRVDGAFARHGVWYGDGMFTVQNGLKTLRFTTTIIGAAGSGDFYIKKGGAAGPIVAFGRYSDGLGQLDATVSSVVDGDTFTLYVAGAAPNTFDNAAYQHMEISGSTNE